LNPPRVAVADAVPVKLIKGETYLYCTCGFSGIQPFCDGAHTVFAPEFMPLKFTYTEDSRIRGLCGCKHNKVTSGPYCDQSHDTNEYVIAQGKILEEKLAAEVGNY